MSNFNPDEVRVRAISHNKISAEGIEESLKNGYLCRRKYTKSFKLPRDYDIFQV